MMMKDLLLVIAKALVDHPDDVTVTEVEKEDGEITLDVYLTVKYGFAIPETAAKVQDAVMSAVETMTGFSVRAVNVHVGGISFN